MDSKFTFASQTCTLTRKKLNEFVIDFDIPRDVKVILPKRSQPILDAPLGYVSLYTHHFSLSNLRFPIPYFICKVLNYFNVHISCFNPFGMVKLTTFAVMCKAYGGEPSVDLLRSFLNLGLAGDWLTLSNRGSADVPKALHNLIIYLENWKEIDFRSFILGGVDGEFNFLHAEDASEGRNSPSSKSVNNDAPMIDAAPLSSVYPSNIVENIADSDDPSYEDDEQTLVGSSLPPHPEASKKHKIPCKTKVASGVPGEALPLKSSLKWAFILSLGCCACYSSSWKQHLRGISIEQLCDIHDRAYIRQAVLDNVLNNRTRELIFALHKAKTAYDAIRAWEFDKDKAYAKLERKCNEALQDLDKNPLIFDMRAEIKAFLKQDRAAVVSRVSPDTAMKLIHSDDLEVAAMEEPFVLEKMSGYRPSSKEVYDQAGDALENASYPFQAEYFVNLYASLEQLLSKKHPLLRPTLSASRSKPLSSKEVVVSSGVISAGLMFDSSSPLECLCFLDNVNLAFQLLFVMGFCYQGYFPPFFKDVQANVSFFIAGLRVVWCAHKTYGNSSIQACTDLGPKCIPHDPSCTSFMMFLACFGPTHLNHGDKYDLRVPDLRYKFSSIILYNGALMRSFLAFCGLLGRVPHLRHAPEPSELEAPSVNSFHAFSGEQSWPLGEIPFEVTIGEAPIAITKTLTFVIVKLDSPHNLMLGRTDMQQMGIVVSTVHGAIKFHTPRGIGTIFLEYNSQKPKRRGWPNQQISRQREKRPQLHRHGRMDGDK
nr:hypothetical protein [Tanacetum cinerariifolium]